MSVINLREGSRETITFVVTQAGVPYNLTGLTVILNTRNGAHAQAAFATDDLPALLILSNPAIGEMQFNPAIDTWQGSVAQYKYELYFEVETALGVLIAFPEYTNLSVIIAPAFG